MPIVSTAVFGAVTTHWIVDAMRMRLMQLHDFAIGAASQGISAARGQVSEGLDAFAAFGVGPNDAFTAFVVRILLLEQSRWPPARHRFEARKSVKVRSVALALTASTWPCAEADISFRATVAAMTALHTPSSEKVELSATGSRLTARINGH